MVTAEGVVMSMTKYLKVRASDDPINLISLNIEILPSLLSSCLASSVSILLFSLKILVMSTSSKTSVIGKRIGILIVPVFLLGLLWACSGEEDGSVDDPQFCKCMKVTDKLNKYSSDLLERQATEKDAKKMKKLRDARQKECSRYFEMSGEEMKKRQAGCKK